MAGVNVGWRDGSKVYWRMPFAGGLLHAGQGVV